MADYLRVFSQPTHILHTGDILMIRLLDIIQARLHHVHGTFLKALFIAWEDLSPIVLGIIFWIRKQTAFCSREINEWCTRTAFCSRDINEWYRYTALGGVEEGLTGNVWRPWGVRGSQPQPPLLDLRWYYTPQAVWRSLRPPFLEGITSGVLHANIPKTCDVFFARAFDARGK